MNAEHERYATWDAAYVLGALSPADRDRFESHLAGCQRCAAAVAEIAPMPGLLSRVPRGRAETLLAADLPDAAEHPDPAGRASLIDLGRARARRTRMLRWTGGLVAAAALVAGILLVPLLTTPTPVAPPAIALEAVDGAPLSATVQLEDVAWGTRVSMSCSYETTGGSGGWEYALVVVAADGTETQLSTWRAYPGRTAVVGAGTALRSSEIAAIEVRSARTGAVLLRTDPSARL